VALPLVDATDPATCGHKAATLGELKRAGYKVPDGFVIPVGALCDGDGIRGALERLGSGPWAVRSSGVAEDLEDASFAGQYETVLGVKTLDEVVAAAVRVRASGSADHVAAYRRSHAAAADEALAVLVQRLVQPAAAGIAFSTNPVTGDGEVVIEAVAGLSEGLAAGDVDADRWVDVGGAARPLAHTGAIDAAAARRIAELARSVARSRGAPQDIEWAIEGGELFLLQARPITELPQEPEITVPPGRWVKDRTHWSGPLTPVGASILLPVAGSAITQMLAEFGLPLESIRPRSFGGEVYMQEIEPGGKPSTGAPPPWWVAAVAFRVVPPLRRMARTAQAALPKLEGYPRTWEDEWRAECARRIDEARATDLEALGDDELVDHLEHLIQEVLAPGLLIHFRLMLPDMVALHDLAMCCEELLGWDTPQMLELLAGLSTAATEPAERMARIAEMVDQEVIAHGLDAVRATPAGPLLDDWLDLWGLRAIEFDPGSPTVAEQAHLVLGLLRNPRPSSGQTEAVRRAAVARASAALDGDDRARFDRALAVAERLHPMREDNVLYTQSLPLGVIRRTLLEIGRRLAAAGRLPAPDDVVFLELEEIRPALQGALVGEPVAARARRRKAERRWVRVHPGPAYHGPPPVPPPSVRGLPAALQRLLGALLWETALEESNEVHASEDGVLVGVAASAGRVTGRVRVIRDETELPRLEAGEILVCPSTHSSWAVVFARAQALVTDHGGMLSHPAIVAREYGIPAVVGTHRATSSLVDGQVVTVDGSTGRVEVRGGVGSPDEGGPYDAL
jgi:pyruvate,water dikinase